MNYRKRDSLRKKFNSYFKWNMLMLFLRSSAFPGEENVFEIKIDINMHLKSIYAIKIYLCCHETRVYIYISSVLSIYISFSSENALWNLAKKLNLNSIHNLNKFWKGNEGIMIAKCKLIFFYNQQFSCVCLMETRLYGQFCKQRIKNLFKDV